MARNTRAGRWVTATLILALVLGAGLALVNRQTIQDTFRAAMFEPSARTEEVLQSLSLTDAGTRVFLASKPTVDGSQRFNSQCSAVQKSEQGHVLGCYTEERIHLFDVTDSRISGIVEVTAAHELMHAVWDRLSESERSALRAELESAYEASVTSDPDLADRMEVYEGLSPNAYADELHSVLATEVSELPRNLEEHFGDWLTDRASVVAAFHEYHEVFDTLRRQAEDLQAQMQELRESVELRTEQYLQDVDTFNKDVAEFTDRNDRYEFSNDPESFELIKNELAWRREQLQLTYDSLAEDIDSFNEMRAELVELSAISSELDQQLDSDLAPVTTRPDANSDT